jgi:hypothetical protein
MSDKPLERYLNMINASKADKEDIIDKFNKVFAMAKVNPDDDNNPLHPMQKLIEQCRKQLEEIVAETNSKEDRTILIDGVRTEKKLQTLLSKSMKIYNTARHA